MKDHEDRKLFLKQDDATTAFDETLELQKPRTGLYLLIALILGVLLSYGSFRFAWNVESESIAKFFQDNAKERAAALRSNIDITLSVVTAMQAFYRASDYVRRDEFAVFSASLLSEHSDIQALEWIPRVPDDQREAYELAAQQNGLAGFQFVERESQGGMVRAGQREEYFPVYYVEPLEGNEAALGFDLASSETRLETLSQARDSGEMLATERITLVQETGEQYGFLVVLPVYVNGEPHDTVEDRRKHLAGFVLGVFRVSDIVTSTFQTLGWANLDMTLTDLDVPPGEGDLFTHDYELNDETELQHNLMYSERIDVAGREWEIEFEAHSQHFQGSRTRTPWVFLLSGLLITALVLRGIRNATAHHNLTYLAFREQRLAAAELVLYKESLEAKVAARTAELSTAMKATADARDNLDAILKSLADGLVATDVKNRVVLMNRAAEDLLGIRLSEVVGQPIEYAIEEKTLKERIIYTLEKCEEGYTFDFEMPGDRADSPGIIRGRTSLIKDMKGELTGIITILHDVTHEREVDRMKTEFISTVAHELRTPLTSIQGFSELLLTRPDIDEKEAKGFLKYINLAAVKLGEVISDLLDIARLESGRSFALDIHPCHVGEGMSQLIPLYRDKHKDHRFELNVEDKKVILNLDKAKMYQVLENLLNNAVKYSPDGGTIRVKVGVTGGNLRLSVTDEGIGMKQEQIEHVFDKFYRVDASNTATGGTGLGMAIVKHIIEAHGGKVWVKSEYGKGTTVTFEIPLREEKRLGGM